MKFKDRSDAGRQLAIRLLAYAEQPDVLVLAMPVGGVPVAAEIALALSAPLDVFLMRKLAVPGQANLAMGTITTGRARVLNHEVVNYLHIPEETIDAVTKQERCELERRERFYRGDRLAPEVRDKTVILVDDGLATGAAMQAASTALREQHPSHLVIALPAIARTTREAIERLSDEIVCAAVRPPDPSLSDGIWYENPRQPTESEARKIISDLSHVPAPYPAEAQTNGT